MPQWISKFFCSTFTALLSTMKKIRNLTQTVALLAFTGSIAVVAPSANAATTNWGPTPFTGGVTEALATFTGVSVGGGAGQFTFDSPMAGMWNSALNFNPGFNTMGSTEEFKYTLATTNGYKFTQAGLTSQMVSGLPGGEFTKKVCSTGFGTGTCVDFSTLNSGATNGGMLSSLGSGFGTMIYVTDTYKTTNDMASIIGISNGFKAEAPQDVPGPLPLLGAGAAFGFSRKLRNRVKSAA